MGKTALYRFFSADDDLLYVGITLNPFVRMKQHAVRKPVHQVCHVRIEWFDDRKAAIKGEFAAIASERPKWNVVGRRKERIVPRAIRISPSEIKNARKRLGWTQHDLASYLGVTQPAVSRIENGGGYNGAIGKLLDALKQKAEQ